MTDSDRRPRTNSRVKVLLTLTVEEADLVDEVRGSVPTATWCRDAVVRTARARKTEER